MEKQYTVVVFCEDGKTIATEYLILAEDIEQAIERANTENPDRVVAVEEIEA